MAIEAELMISTAWCLTDRVEKEKSQLKSELDDIRSQLDHIAKGKVKYWDTLRHQDGLSWAEIVEFLRDGRVKYIWSLRVQSKAQLFLSGCQNGVALNISQPEQ